MRWLDSITSSMDVDLSKFREMVKDREAWRAAVHRTANSQTRLTDWTVALFLQHVIALESYRVGPCQIAFSHLAICIQGSSTSLFPPTAHFFLVPNSHCLNAPCFIHSPTLGHLGGFQVAVAVMNKTSSLCRFLWTSKFSAS